MDEKNDPQNPLEQNLKYLKLVFMKENYAALAKQAAKKQSSHIDYLEKPAKPCTTGHCLKNGELGLGSNFANTLPFS